MGKEANLCTCVFSPDVEAVFSSVAQAGGKTVKLEIDEVGPLGSTDTAFERSHYTFYKEDGSTFDHGKWVSSYVPNLVLTYYIIQWNLRHGHTNN